MIVWEESAVTFVKCKVLTAVKIKITIVSNVASSSLVYRYQRFGGICCLHIWG